GGVGGEGGGGDEDRAGGGALRYGIERAERVVAQRLVHDGGDDLPGGHDAERVAVLVGARDRLVAERAGGAGPVLDHHRLAEPLLQRLGDDAADDVGAAAGPERHDHLDRPLRPVLRPCIERAAEQRGGGQTNEHTSRQHRIPPLGPRQNMNRSGRGRFLTVPFLYRLALLRART